MTTYVPHTTVSKALARFGIVLAGVAAALMVWVLAVGVETPRTPAVGGAPPSPLTAPEVLVAALVAGLVGWAALAVLERLTVRAVSVWRTLATTVFLLSLGGPLTGDDVSIASRVALVVMHVAVAAVVIPLLPLADSSSSEGLR
ncbi:MAG TPA: DUF6069 family protein [Nocardioidaceae bacterium]|nr:DUF6069 family protein [Nocardioidaceae bacterium]